MAPSQELQQQNPFSILDTLYCEEEKWEDFDDHDEENNIKDEILELKTPFLLPLLFLNQDLFHEDEELLSLFSKEKQGCFIESSLGCLRKEVVEWIMKVNSYNGFSSLTCVVAVNYLDRFLTSFEFGNDKQEQQQPWMFQLAGVACLSLAAKVEETYVPLLLDLQGEGGKYLFDAKTIQKMELLVLSTLEWKMNNPMTPLSFLHHIIKRLGFKNHLHWEFLRRCELLLLSFLSDWRFVNYLPSVVATATMMHVIDQIEPCNPIDYQNQLLAVLNISKDKVNDCYKLIVEKSSRNKKSDDNNNAKRTFDEMVMAMNNFSSPPTTTSSSDVTYPSSPSGVTDVYYLSSISSNDAWVATTNNIIGTSSSSSLSSSLESSVSSSPVIPRKKSRVHEQSMPISQVFVEMVASPR